MTALAFVVGVVVGFLGALALGMFWPDPPLSDGYERNSARPEDHPQMCDCAGCSARWENGKKRPRP